MTRRRRASNVCVVAAGTPPGWTSTPDGLLFPVSFPSAIGPIPDLPYHGLANTDRQEFRYQVIFSQRMEEE
jgi:hypothetical protein